MIPIAQGISGFDVEVIDTAKDGSTKNTIYTNGGKGFPFDDAVVTQPALTCNSQKDSGLFNLTVAVSCSLGVTWAKCFRDGG